MTKHIPIFTACLFLLQSLQFACLVFEVGHQFCGQAVRTGFHVWHHVRNSCNLPQRVFPLQNELLGREVLVPHPANDLRKIDGMFRLVIGTLRETARQVSVVAVLTELALRVSQQLFRAAQRNGRITSNAGAIGIRQQATRLRQVLGLDGDQFRFAVQRGCLDVAALGIFQVAALH